MKLPVPSPVGGSRRNPSASPEILDAGRPFEMRTDAQAFSESSGSPASVNETLQPRSLSPVDPPRRGLSLRARSGSASLANAVRNLARARSPPHVLVQPQTSSPISSNLHQSPNSPLKEGENPTWERVYEGNVEQDLLSPRSTLSHNANLPQSAVLPAGAAPLLGRASSSTSSPPTSALSTPALPGVIEIHSIVAAEHPHGSSVSLSKVFETFSKPNVGSVAESRSTAS